MSEQEILQALINPQSVNPEQLELIRKAFSQSLKENYADVD
jgi:hypothetical protein